MVVMSAKSMAKMQYPSLYVGELRQMTGYYLGWVPNEYADNIGEDNMYAVVENDDAVKHADDQLSLMVAGQRVKIKIPSSPTLQKLCNIAISEIRYFHCTRKSLMQKSTLYGLGLQQKYYREQNIDGFKGKWQICYRTQEVDRRRLRIERKKPGKTGFKDAYWTLYKPEHDAYIILRDRGDGEKYELGSAVQDYIWMTAEQEELYPYWKGIADIIYDLCWMKHKVYQYWADYCERWGHGGMIHAALDLQKGLFSGALTGVANQQARADYIMDHVDNMVSNNCFVTDIRDQVKILQSGSSGVNVCKELIENINNRIHLIFLAAATSTSTADRGGYSSARIHLSQTETKVGYHRKTLEEVILTDLVFDFIYRNRINLYKMGIRVPNRYDVQVKIYALDSDMGENIEEKQSNQRDEAQNKEYYENKLQKKDKELGG